VKDREPAVEMKRPTYSSRGLKTQSMDWSMKMMIKFCTHFSKLSFVIFLKLYISFLFVSFSFLDVLWPRKRQYNWWSTLHAARNTGAVSASRRRHIQALTGGRSSNHSLLTLEPVCNVHHETCCHLHLRVGP
jgi:hypothetical protein